MDDRTIDLTYNWMTFDEYRYDALGRRVYVRSRRVCASGTPANPDCMVSYARRTVWAGSQELWEIQRPDDGNRETEGGTLPTLAQNATTDPNLLFGSVAYTYGLETDQPLTVIRVDYKNYLGHTFSPFSIIPLWTVRGTADTSYQVPAPGGAVCINNNTECVKVQYSDPYWQPAFSRYYKPGIFNGTLLSDKADHTGLLFRRNRYYDPATGRFTQEDPIGLAGGLNLYGYANGDPANYSDPFGLLPCCVLMLGEGAQRAVLQGNRTVAEQARVAKIEQEAMFEYARERAESNTMLIMGGLELGWGVLRAGAGIARNLPQAETLAERFAFKEMLFGPGRVIAGGASGEAFRDAPRIASTYGGRAADWVKMSSAGKWADHLGRQFETHWVENLKTGVKVEAKFKLVRDVQ